MYARPSILVVGINNSGTYWVMMVEVNTSITFASKIPYTYASYIQFARMVDRNTINQIVQEAANNLE